MSEVHSASLLAAFKCLDCECDTCDVNEYYMVRDHLWRKAVPKRTGMLCIGCLETRLGRTLTKADFTDVPVNKGWCPQSPRLLSRLAA